LNLILVFLGAGIGGVLRFATTSTAHRLFGAGFPVGTLLVNVVGSVLMGLVAGHFLYKGDIGSAWRLFLATGVLGGFTTFSAFSLDVITLIERGDWLLAGAYILGSVILSIAGLALGLWLMK
jgi:fluoride exporter